MHLRTPLCAAGFPAAFAALAAAVAFAATRLDQQPTASDDGGPIYLPQAQYLRPMSLGYENALADILWFRTISYFGEHYRSDRTYPWLAYMCDLVTDLDPRAAHVYSFAGVILPWEAGQADAGIRLLEKGTRTFPDSWLLHYYLGFNHYFFKSDYAAAIKHLRQAAESGQAHPAVAQLAALLAAHQYGPETTLQFLAQLEQNAGSEDMRMVVQQNIREVRMAADLDLIAEAVEAYRARQGSIPPSLGALVEAQLLPEVPADPFGGTYLIDPHSGAVTSSTGRTPSRLHRSTIRDKAARGESVRDL